MARGGAVNGSGGSLDSGTPWVGSTPGGQPYATRFGRRPRPLFSVDAHDATRLA
jgi:hypothetical protein